MSFPKTALHSVKGMKDLFGEYVKKKPNKKKFLFFFFYSSLLKHQTILKTSRKILNKFGFSPVILNILEHEEVFKRTLGESSEIITKVPTFFRNN